VRRKLLVGAAMVPLILATLAARIIKAELPSDSTAPADAGSCDRACLDGFVNEYLDALVAHDPPRLPFAKNAKFTEDGQRLALGDGFWRTASARGGYEFYMEDVSAGQVAFFGTMREADHPVSLVLRLKIEDRRISEVETIVVREGMISSRPSDTGAADLEKLGSPDPLFLQDVPPTERVSRNELAKTANKYFSGMQRNDGKGDYSFFTDDCGRVENGIVATNGHEGEAGPIGSRAQNNSIQNSSNQGNASRNTSYATLAIRGRFKRPTARPSRPDRLSPGPGRSRKRSRSKTAKYDAFRQSFTAVLME
jgi:hypothetical protein